MDCQSRPLAIHYKGFHLSRTYFPRQRQVSRFALENFAHSSSKMPMDPLGQPKFLGSSLFTSSWATFDLPSAQTSGLWTILIFLEQVAALLASPQLVSACSTSSSDTHWGSLELFWLWSTTGYYRWIQRLDLPSCCQMSPTMTLSPIKNRYKFYMARDWETLV